MKASSEWPLSPVFRETFLRRCAPLDGTMRDFGGVLDRLAPPSWFGTPEWAREQYRAAVRELRQAEDALVDVRRNSDRSNREFSIATVAVLYRTAQ